MGMASYDEKLKILAKMRANGGKYAKPFDKGELAQVNFLGGDWNEYASVVFDMIMADTLLDVVAQLSHMNQQLATLNATLAPQRV
jgi:hypothetical protein